MANMLPGAAGQQAIVERVGQDPCGARDDHAARPN